MSEDTQTWHYGLVARFWAERLTDGPEIAYFREQIERYGEPALDAGCGTGRLLIPFLQAGLDVDGCDVSPDMLALGRERAEHEGFQPRLYAQALHELDLPRRYQTIVACGVFGIGVTREKDRQALQRLYDQLTPGGVLLLDHYLPYGDSTTWSLWQKETRSQLPEPWSDKVGTTPPGDGSAYALHSRIISFDPLEQCVTREMRAELWRDGALIAEEQYTLTENLYLYHELRLLIEQVGLGIEAVQGGYTGEELTADHEVMVFVARK